MYEYQSHIPCQNKKNLNICYQKIIDIDKQGQKYFINCARNVVRIMIRAMKKWNFIEMRLCKNGVLQTFKQLFLHSTTG